MDIKNIADLGKIADLCRKKGIETIKIASDGSVEIKLKDSLPKKGNRKSVAAEDAPEVQQLTEEELLFWSSAATIPNIEGAH